MNTSDRAKLRSIAMTEKAITQVGKNGVTDTVLKQVDEQLTARELVKVSVLRNSDDDVKTVAAALADALGAEIVQTLGFKITLYRFSTTDGVKHLL